MGTVKKKSTSTAAGSDALAAFFDRPESKRLSTAEFVSQGVTLVSAEYVHQLVPRLPALRERIEQITDSTRLRARLELLARFLSDTDGAGDSSATARREAAFALSYFEHHGDRIPDATPEYGLLDDALIIEAVLERNGAALRQHWKRAGVDLPDSF